MATLYDQERDVQALDQRFQAGISRHVSVLAIAIDIIDESRSDPARLDAAITVAAEKAADYRAWLDELDAEVSAQQAALETVTRSVR